MTGLKTLVAVIVAALFSFAGLFAYMAEQFAAQRRADCEQSLEIRAAGTEDKVNTWRDVQDIAYSDPEYAQYFDELFARIRARDAALPKPATCD